MGAARRSLAYLLSACLTLCASVPAGAVDASRPASAPAVAVPLQLFLSGPSAATLRQDAFWLQVGALHPARPRDLEALEPLAQALPAGFAALARSALIAEGPAREEAAAAAEQALRAAREAAARAVDATLPELHGTTAKALESGASASALSSLARRLRIAGLYRPEAVAADLGAVADKLRQLRLESAWRRARGLFGRGASRAPALIQARPLGAPASARLQASETSPNATAPDTPPPAPAAPSSSKARSFFSTLKAMCLGDPTIREFTAGKRRQLIVARLMRLGDVVLTLSAGWGMGRLIDIADKGHSVPAALVPFIAVSAAMVATKVVELASDLKYMLMVGSLEYQLIRDFRVDLFKRLFSFKPSFFRQNDSQAIANRLSDDVSYLSTTGVDTPLATPYHIVQVAASLGVIFWTDLHAFLPSGGQPMAARAATLLITALLIAVMVVRGLVSSRAAGRFETLEENYQNIRSDMMAHAQKAVSDREVYLGMGIEEHPISQFERKARQLSELGVSEIKVQRGNEFKQRVLGLLSTDLLITLAVSSLLFFTGHPSVGMITALTSYAIELTQGVEGLSNDYIGFKKSLGGSAKIRSMREEPLDLDGDDAVTLGPLLGRIEFRDVSFSYDPDGPPALQNVSFTIEPGESVAIVGPSGSGKSTILKLMTRVYRPASGQILVDGKDLETVQIKTLRQQLAIVPQESGLFDDTVAANLLAVDPTASMAQLEQALRDAAVLDDVLAKSQKEPPNLEDALKTAVSEFSGGQRQRIAIARALLRRSNLMLLDEWSSALDQNSEQKVLQALGRLREGKTTVMVDHNLRFDKKKTRILVVDGGRIVASGQHDALLKSSPLYAELVKIARDNIGPSR